MSKIQSLKRLTSKKLKLLKCPTVTSSWYKKLDNTSMGYQGKNFEWVPCVAKHAQSTDSLKMQI